MRILILMALIFSLNSLAHEAPAHSRYQILVTDPTTSTVTEESFAQIPSVIFSQNYQEFIANKQSVKTNLEWKTPYFSAWVTDDAPGIYYTISIWGGLARIPGMNDKGSCGQTTLLVSEPR